MKRYRTAGMVLVWLAAAGRLHAQVGAPRTAGAQAAGVQAPLPQTPAPQAPVPGGVPQAASSPAAAPAAVTGADVAPLFRVFLKDHTSLVSYGEMARVDNRVVFSMPTSSSDAAPQLQLINIPSDTVDWERTLNYAESVRAIRYLVT